MPGPIPVMPGLTGHPFPAGSYLRGAFFEDIPCRELSIAEVLPFFDWKLFYAIWGMKPASRLYPDPSTGEESPEPPRSARASEVSADISRLSEQQLRSDAESMLTALRIRSSVHIRLSARFDACHAEGDDIVSTAWRLPMLRQESPEGRSLADFVAPEAYGFDSPSGMFAISSVALGSKSHPAGCDCPACSAMNYDSLLERSLRLTLAEAASGWLDAELARQLPERSPVRIIKPAAGYASCPDHSLKRDILALLPGASELDIRLTESCAMIPDASICGLIFAHPQATYPEIRRLSPTALDAYALRRGFSPEEARLFLGNLL